MKKNDNFRYLTFPICLLNGAFEDIRNVCNNIFDYTIYKHSLQLEMGTEKDRMNAALKYYGIKAGNIKRMTENGKLLVESISYKLPLTSINKDLIFDYYNNHKNEFEIACLLAFSAIKSILGKKEYCKTNKELIIARMFGFISIKELSEKTPILLKKYSKRYQIDKILNELQFNWHLKLFSNHSRGFYLSIDYNLEQLAKINIEAKKSTKLNRLKNAKKEALIAANESLKNQKT